VLPLEGITVVSLEHAIAAPFATRQLADLGARVIKIERPDGGDFARNYDERVNGLSSHFVWCNRSKESLALDLKSEDGPAILDALLSRADVFVQNLAPGAVERLGFGYAQIRERYPRLIMCEISGYGLDGPHRDRKAYDLLIQAESGFLSVTGTDADMVKAGCSIADIAAGMYAYSNILAALIERSKSGKGRHIDISMLEAMAEWMGHPMYYAYEGAAPPPRVGASHATIYPYGPFPTATGDVVFAIQNEREWSAFCAGVLEDAELATDDRFSSTSRRSANRSALRQIISEGLSQLDRNLVLERLDRARIANADARDMAGLWDHAQLAQRGRWTDVPTPIGPVPALLPPGRESARMEAVPALGAHTQSILEELGFRPH
jgi:itaconate CoA-transferase